MEDRFYYAWLNDIPKKKFKVTKNKTIFTTKLIDYGVKLLGKDIKQIPTGKKNILILTNGIDTIEFKEEIGIEEICKINKEKFKKRLKAEEAKDFWETDIGKHILKNVQ